MKLIVCAILAYFVSGVVQVWKDLSAESNFKPMWAYQPTVGKCLKAMMMWFLPPFINNGYIVNQKEKAVAHGFLNFIVQMSVLTGLIWYCTSASGHIFNSNILRIITAGVFIIIGTPFVLMLGKFIMIIPMLVASVFIDLVLLPLLGKQK